MGADAHAADEYSDEVAQYAEGHRITYFALGSVDDGGLPGGTGCGLRSIGR
jgi:hypothetical protein